MILEAKSYILKRMTESLNFVFFGIVGSGKGTQARLLMDYLKEKTGTESLYVGTGDEFRKLLGSGSLTAEIVRKYLERGELAPDFLTTTMFANVLQEGLAPEKHLVADGYPRTIGQSKDFEEMMKFYKRNQIKIIDVEVSEAEAIKRNMLRGRHDDTKEGLALRIDRYKNKVIPSMNYFAEKEGYEIYKINGEQTAEEVHKEIIC